MLFYILIVFIIGFICFNIAPIMFFDTFGYYLIIKTKHYVHQEKDSNGDITIYNDIVTIEIIKEKCNAWLIWYNLVKLKPNIEEWEFDSEKTHEIWDKIK